jgi:hypothetical protein
MPEEIMESDKAHVNLEHIALQTTSSLELNEVLTTISQGLVDELGAAFARIWLLGSGDLCNECFNASSCQNRESCLHLEASAGMYTNLNGEFRRVPLGVAPIGRIANDNEPIISANLDDDNRFPDQEFGNWVEPRQMLNNEGCMIKIVSFFRLKLMLLIPKRAV